MEERRELEILEQSQGEGNGARSTTTAEPTERVRVETVAMGNLGIISDRN